MPLVPGVVPRVPCVVPLVPGVVPLTPCVVPLVPCVVPPPCDLIAFDPEVPAQAQAAGVTEGHDDHRHQRHAHQ